MLCVPADSRSAFTQSQPISQVHMPGYGCARTYTVSDRPSHSQHEHLSGAAFVASVCETYIAMTSSLVSKYRAVLISRGHIYRAFIVVHVDLLDVTNVRLVPATRRFLPLG
jgi:hypothetical protein